MNTSKYDPETRRHNKRVARHPLYRALHSRFMAAEARSMELGAELNKLQEKQGAEIAAQAGVKREALKNLQAEFDKQAEMLSKLQQAFVQLADEKLQLEAEIAAATTLSAMGD